MNINTDRIFRCLRVGRILSYIAIGLCILSVVVR